MRLDALLELYKHLHAKDDPLPARLKCAGYGRRCWPAR